jgi:protein-tyrosine phosphatase
LLSVQIGYIRAAPDEIDARYGSFDAYLKQALGVDAATRARLVELMTEPSG